MSILDKLDEAEKAATPGPWKDFDTSVDCGNYCQGGSAKFEIYLGPEFKFKSLTYDEFEFLLLMRNNIRALIDVARAA